ncbi:hypothetical protein AVEN_99589-1 [Araneus ventricosus]|uniref:Uncharacterized protein n=1 Tax=Araneus ventricosus TaxID=182803 RepID=A0A4Y2ETK7_ARAVE|nr:hypothetical protein AVEN_99589-1 [Araneus ventricosus]
MRNVIRFLLIRNASACGFRRQIIEAHDLVPSDDLVFPQMKEYLSGTWFPSDDEVKAVAKNLLNEKAYDFYHAVMNKLVHKSDKCLNRLGDYV